MWNFLTIGLTCVGLALLGIGIFVFAQYQYDKKSNEMWKRHKENKRRNKKRVWGNDDY